MERQETQTELAPVVEAIWQQQLESFDLGRLIPAETFLQKHPQLLSVPDVAVDVIFNEYELCAQDVTNPVDPQQFIDRFPQYGGLLSKQFKLLDVFESAALERAVHSGSEKSEVDNCSELQRFRDRKIIGQGATATVELAFDEKLQQPVALKRLHTHLQNSNRASQRLQREAQTVARLHHPNIIPIYEIIEDDGQFVLVSRYVSGMNLRDLSESSNKQETPQIVEWMQQIAEALHYSHENDVVHRDVKPSNIIVDQEHNAMLTDFGLASFSQSSGVITQTGEMIGTPAFMSPEQALGNLDAVDHRTDIYSLGATAYYLLSGRPPFAGTFANVVQQVVAEEAPSLKSLGVAVGSDLATITAKCLSKSPTDRYQSARELADDLRRFQCGESIRARKVGPLERMIKLIRRRPWLSAAVATSLLLAAFLSGTLFQLGEIRDQRNRAQDAEHSNRELLASASVDAGKLSMRNGDLGHAIAHFQNSIEQGVDDPANVHLLLVEAMMGKGDIELAAENLKLASSFDQPALRPLVKYWETELSAIGHADYQTTSLNEHEFTKLALSKQHFFKGFNASNSMVALKHFEQAVASDPTHRSARRMSLIMAFSLARFNDVLAGTETARQMYPDDVDFQLLESLARSCTDDVVTAKTIIDNLRIAEDQKKKWIAFCEFLFKSVSDNSVGSVNNNFLHRIAALLTEFNSEFLPLVESRRWRFPPKIADLFMRLSSQDLTSLNEADWLALSNELVAIHPEATLLVIAGEVELLAENPLEELQNARNFFLNATQSPSFINASKNSAWLGLYTTSMALFIVHNHEPETNQAYMTDSAVHIDPKWLSNEIKLRSMYIPLIKIDEWDLAKPFIDRKVQIATSDVFISEGLWHLALWHKHRNDWAQVVRVCNQREAMVSKDYQKSCPLGWNGLKKSAVSELQSLLED